MERLVNDSIAENLAKKVTEQVTDNFRPVLATIINELASTRKSNQQLTSTVQNMQSEIAELNRKLEEKVTQATVELQKTRLNNQKAAEILKVATKELGLSE